jgi:guanylate kinase
MGSAQSNTPGKLIIFSGPSGTGKTTMVHHLLQKRSDLAFSISATTRPKREGEKEGTDYYFLSPAEFEKKIEQGAFLEYEEVYPDVYYGTLHEEVKRLWGKGYHVLFDVDVKGALNIKKQYPDRSLAVLVCPPSIDTLKSRILKRADQPPSNLSERLERAREELSYKDQFDYALVNDTLSKAWKEAEQIVESFLMNSN